MKKRLFAVLLPVMMLPVSVSGCAGSQSVQESMEYREDVEATDGKQDVAEALLQLTSNPSFVIQMDGDFVEGARSGEVIAGISGVWNATAMRDI